MNAPPPAPETIEGDRVAMWLSLDQAVLDQRRRPGTVLFDLHGLWWVAPVDLTLRQIDAQISAELARLDLRPLPHHLGATYRPRDYSGGGR